LNWNYPRQFLPVSRTASAPTTLFISGLIRIEPSFGQRIRLNRSLKSFLIRQGWQPHKLGYQHRARQIALLERIRNGP